MLAYLNSTVLRRHSLKPFRLNHRTIITGAGLNHSDKEVSQRATQHHLVYLTAPGCALAQSVAIQADGRKPS